MATRGFQLFALFIAFSVTMFASLSLTDKAIKADAHQNARTAYHLVHTGVWGRDSEPTSNPTPQIKREPLPILVIAAYLIADPAFDDPYTIADITGGGPLTKRIKNVNLGWIFLTVLAIFNIAPWITHSLWAAMTIASVAVLLSIPLFIEPRYLDTLYSETAATDLMSWVAVFGLRSSVDKKAINLIVFGGLLGSLIMTKAAFLYIVSVFVVIYLVLNWIRYSDGVRPNLRAGAIALFAVVAVSSPWLIRNAAVFGGFFVAARGGDILALRATLMDAPLAGTFYAFTPEAYRDLVGAVTSFSPKDLGQDGELAVLDDSLKSNRWDYYKTWLAREGVEYGNRLQAEGSLTRLAVGRLLESPVKYILSIPVYYYRGIWWLNANQLHEGKSLYVKLIFYVMVIISHILFFSVGLYSVIMARPKLFAIFGLSLGWLLFYAMFTHNIIRYGVPPIPIFLLAMVWIAYLVARQAAIAVTGWLNFADKFASEPRSGANENAAHKKKNSISA